MFLGNKEDLFTTGIYWVEVLVGLAVVAGIGYCLRTICIAIVGEELGQSLRLASYEAILRQPVGWFDFEANSPGFLYARLASDIPFIRNVREASCDCLLVPFKSTLFIIGGWC